MYINGKKNVNVKEIIDEYEGYEKPTHDGIDTYVETETYVQYPRDPREKSPLPVIDSDEKKPQDKDDYVYRMKKLANSQA